MRVPLRTFQFGLWLGLLLTGSPLMAQVPNSDRVADITSAYQDLSFAGSVRSQDRGGSCEYTIPELVIRFNKVDGRLTKAVYLDQFRVMAAREPAEAPEKRSQIWERRYPLVAALTAPGTEVRTVGVEFTIPKSTMREADYIGLGVVGRAPLQDDGRFALLDPIERSRVLEGRRVAWLISAPSNKISQVLSAEGERAVSTVRRSLSNPDDACSTAKIR